MRKIISVLLCVLLLASLLPVSAFADTTASGKCGKDVTWTYEDGVLTISGTGAMENYIDFDTIKDSPWEAYCSSIRSIVINEGVTSIGYYAFYCIGSLTSVTIPNSVTSIGQGAFYRCSSLTSVTIPDSVTSVGQEAFEDCSSLTSVIIPGSVVSIDKSTFYGCSSLTGVTISEGVTSVGNYAFRDCSSLVSVVIPDSVKSIGDYAFENCSSLTSVTIPDSVTSIGISAFYNCSSLTSVTIPDSVTSIGYSAFSGCSSLTSATIGNGVASIGDCAFSDCSSLTSVTIGNGVASIGNSAFEDCSSLTSVMIPDSVTSIGDWTFYHCSSLVSVVIPNNVTVIGNCAFSSCNKLSDIAFGGTEEAWTSISKGVNAFPSSPRMHYNCSSLDSHYIPIERKDPSCATTGYIKYSCACGYEFTEMLPQSHDYVFIESVAATCSNAGYDVYKCSKCGKILNKSNGEEQLPHEYEFTKVVEPTCLKGGYTLYKCSVCGDEYKDNLTPLLGHSMVEVGEKPATCAEAGHTAGVQCSRCGLVESGVTEIPALGHSYGAWTQTKAPTCTAKGTETKSCSRCDATETREVAALGHDYEHGKCTRCGEKDPNYIAAPVLKITTSAGKPKISWSKVDGAAKYKVYRSTDGKKYDLLATTTGTSITNTKAKIGTKYYYVVKAVNANGDESEFSNVESIKCRPAAPTVTISRSGGKAKLSWKAVSGATKYWVYRSTDGKKYTRVISTTKLSYADSKSKSGTKYYYKVMAVAVVNETNVGSACSAVKSITTTLAKPTVKITTVSGKPKLSWSKVTGADKYYVYRSTNGKDYTLLVKTTKTSVTNTGAKKGVKYYYKVKAICSANTKANSAFSAVVSIKATK